MTAKVQRESEVAPGQGAASEAALRGSLKLLSLPAGAFGGWLRDLRRVTTHRSLRTKNNPAGALRHVQRGAITKPLSNARDLIARPQALVVCMGVHKERSHGKS